MADINNHGLWETSRATTTVSTDATGSVSVTNFVVSNTAPDALEYFDACHRTIARRHLGIFLRLHHASELFAARRVLRLCHHGRWQPIADHHLYQHTGAGVVFSMPSILPAGNFIVTANTCGLSVAFPGTRQITVQYARAMAGLDSAVLEVTLPLGSNPRCGCQHQVPLFAVGHRNRRSAGDHGYRYHDVPRYLAQRAIWIQTITITNTGGVNLSISAIANSNSSAFFDTTNGAPPQAAHYCGFGSNAAGVPLAGGPIIIAPMATCQLNIAFKAIAVGANTANIVISSNDPMFATRP